MKAEHESVLMKEVLRALDVRPDDTVVDATLGGAGHFRALLGKLGEGGTLIGIDADPAAVERGRQTYANDRRPERPVAHLVNDDFRNLARILERLGIGSVDKILFDLGWSGYQLAEPRGFSFQNDEPLIMTYGDGRETAADIVNGRSQVDLSDLLFEYGEEKFARRISHSIVAARAHERILTTGALVRAILAATPVWYHARKINAATKTFQALRIVANDEIGALREGLAAAFAALGPGGTLAVISFHSVEDRVVKNLLREAVATGLGMMKPKKPIVPTREEILDNRRARSAKLRVFARIGNPAKQEIVDSFKSIPSYA